MPSRDDFSPAVKRNLAVRAAYFCSNPNCLRLTAGPHSNDERSLSTGHAAHIHAAAQNGPRFEPSQTPAQRRSITNAIWLCRVCGDRVDKDVDGYSAESLRGWKRNHEALINEVGSKGYAQSLALMQARREEPDIARRIIALLEDRRVLWAAFDAEFPDRVRRSLDGLREQLTSLRVNLREGSALDNIIQTLTRTIHAFFDQVEQSDLRTLRCNGHDPEWLRFQDALRGLRKAVGLQVGNLAAAYELRVGSDLQQIMPAPADAR
jgi:hypothetical protein